MILSPSKYQHIHYFSTNPSFIPTSVNLQGLFMQDNARIQGYKIWILTGGENLEVAKHATDNLSKPVMDMWLLWLLGPWEIYRSIYNAHLILLGLPINNYAVCISHFFNMCCHLLWSVLNIYIFLLCTFTFFPQYFIV